MVAPGGCTSFTAAAELQIGGLPNFRGPHKFAKLSSHIPTRVIVSDSSNISQHHTRKYTGNSSHC